MFWNGSVCLLQLFDNASCSQTDNCRIDLNLTCIITYGNSFRQCLWTDFIDQFITTTAITTTTTTTAPCPTGYVRTSSSACVNLLIDFNNCGSIGYVCNSTYMSCSSGICSMAPAVLLVGGVSVPGWGDAYSVDDSYLSINLSCSISMYNYSTSNPALQSNGCVCLGGCSTAYSNTRLPASSFSGSTASGHWDDLYIYSNTSQTVYYGTTGTYLNLSVVFEFHTGYYSQPTQYVHFQIVFYENSPNIVRYYYNQVYGGGASATIGTQNMGGTVFRQYSFNQAGIIPVGNANATTPTLTITCDTNVNTCL